MLISEEMAAALSKQVGAEYFAALQYDMVAAYFERQALPELTALFRAQADEEITHAQRLIDYINETGGVLAIPAIRQGRADFGSIEEAVQTVHDNELSVTETFNRLMDRAIGEHDHLARGMLQWFVDEQLEEMSLIGDLLQVVRRAGDDLHYVEQYVAKLPKAPVAGAGPV